MKKVLKRSLSVPLAVCIIFSSAYVGLSEVDFSGLFTVKAEAASSGTCGINLTWTLDDEGTLTVSGTGEMIDVSWDSNAPWYESIANIKTVVIDNGVKSIGDYAFRGCTSLTSVIILEGVTSIGVHAFYSCTSLTSITIPDSVTKIGQYAFLNTDYYNNISNWEYDVLYIGNHLIKANTSLSGEYTIKNGTKTIADSAFMECTDLTSISFPDSVTSISGYAFYNCTSLTSISFPDSVTSIGGYAFSNCTSLTSITMLDSITSIGREAFSNCTNLTSITIPDSVTKIGQYAFSNTGCYNDSSNWKNDGLYIGNHLIKANTSLSGEYTIKNGTKTIAGCAFSFCTSLTSITIPDSVTSIGDGAFNSCDNLKSVEISDSVTSIGDYAFEYCTSLTSITIPNSVTSIGTKAFYNCASDFTIYCYRDSYAMQYAIDNSLNYVIMDIGETDNCTIDYTNNLIFTEQLGVTSIEDIIYAPATSVVTKQASLISGKNEYFGTASKITVVDNGVSTEYTLVVDGDTNGDSVCDVLDAAQVARASNGFEDLEGAYAMAADSNSDDIVDINDYQSIVNKVVA